MIKSALPTLFAFLILFAPVAGTAQFGVEVEVRYGSAIHYHEIQGADDSGQSAGLGLNLAYRTKTIWARVLRLEMKYHQISGLVNVQTLNKIVPGFDPDEPSTLVSARSHVPGLHALS
ncbi:MAG: hypothetical protein WA952_12200, partial [Lewinella sp.]